MSRSKIIVLGTGGTIAGTASSAADNVGYTAAQLGVAELLAQVAPPGGDRIDWVTEQVAQLDSKDMDVATWRALLQRCAYWLAQDDVRGLVVTHGTDTLEETAFLLQAVLAPSKPVVLASAMRPATALSADGPRNLLDACSVAAHPGVRGVVVVCAGRVHGAVEVQKVHSARLDAFDSGDAGVLGYVEADGLRQVREWPVADAVAVPGAFAALTGLADWPRVEVVLSHAGAGSALVQALVAQGCRGIVVAGTGNGTVHQALQSALCEARAAGVQVLRSTRCVDGRALAMPDDVLPATALPPLKARIALMLALAKTAA